MKTVDNLLEMESLRDFLQLHVEFLIQYEWIFNFKVTHILVDGVKDRIPSDWLEFLSNTSLEEFNTIFMGPLSNDDTENGKDNLSEIPECIKKILESLHVLKISYKNHPQSNATFSQDLRKGMNPKKLHEVVQFSDLIIKVCAREYLTKVLDIGSGVGYLAEALTRGGLDVVGVEGCEGHAEGAEKRRVKKCNNFPTIHVNVDSSDDCGRTLLMDCEHDVGVVGLHCCGDLTPDLIKLFIKLDQVHCLMLVSCCYHKMGKNEDGTVFVNFPMSCGLKKHVIENEGSVNVIDVPTLRLGAQETVIRWVNMDENEHEQHMRNVGYRAILETFAGKMNSQLVKRRRKGVKQKGFDNFESFLEAVPETYELNDEALENFSQMRTLHAEHKEDFRIYELLTGLQFLLQSVIENLLILDRIEYIQENLGESVQVKVLEIFDDDLSPRNKVILVTKCKS